MGLPKPNPATYLHIYAFENPDPAIGTATSEGVR